LAIDVYKDWLVSPEGPRPPDHYQLLRLVEFEDSAEKVRTNYKKLNAHVRRYATGQYLEESQALLNELAKAMLCLTDTERKREYDLGLGRIFEEEEAGPRTMDAILLQQNHISSAQAQEAKEHAERTGLELRDSFVQLKIVTADIAAQALALELGLPYVDLADLHPEDEVLDQVPKKTVKQNSILPLFIDEGKLLVACAHQLEHELEQELQMRFGVPARCVLAAPRDISQAINKYYAPGVRNVAAASAVADTAGTSKKGTEKNAAAKEPPKPQRRGPRTPEEISERKKIGVVVFNFSFLLAYLLDTWVITPGAYDIWTAGLYLVIPGIAALVVWQTFFKN
jgi:hypothetical protein